MKVLILTCYLRKKSNAAVSVKPRQYRLLNIILPTNILELCHFGTYSAYLPSRRRLKFYSETSLS